jgi:uncharacterized protein (DUF2252 family)
VRSKLTRDVDGERRFVSEPPLIVPLAELAAPDEVAALVQDVLHGYVRSLPHERRVLFERFHLVDAAQKVVGVGSVATRCWAALLLGRDDDDPLVLQVKEASASVLEDSSAHSEPASHGRRVVEGQRLIQASSDIFLGWVHLGRDLDGQPRDYYVRQLRDWKASLDLETILPRGLARYAQACGWTLARAHARSGDRIAIASYLGRSDRFDRAVAEYAVSYADLNERDHRALAEAVADGRLSALEGV